MIFIEFQVVEFFESALCLRRKFINDVQSLITNFIIHTDVNRDESIIFTDFLFIHEALENFKEFLFGFQFQDWNSSDNEMVFELLIKLRSFDFFNLILFFFSDLFCCFFQENFIFDIVIFSFSCKVNFFVEINHFFVLLICYYKFKIFFRLIFLILF